jgi:hypothetical protein
MGVQWGSTLAIQELKKVYDSVRMELLCSILTESCIPMKKVSPNKMCLNDIYAEVHINKHLSVSYSKQS